MEIRTAWIYVLNVLPFHSDSDLDKALVTLIIQAVKLNHFSCYSMEPFTFLPCQIEGVRWCPSLNPVLGYSSDTEQKSNHQFHFS